MPVSLGLCRRTLLGSAALLVVVAVVVAAGVIPLVKADTFRAARPESAVPAFWVNIVLCLLAAAVLARIAMRTKEGRSLSRTVLAILGLLALFLALALTDAAFAYRSHGPGMRTASIILFVSSAADLLVAVLLVTTAFVYPRSTTN